jgi:galactosamine-6-phosphate isomerase
MSFSVWTAENYEALSRQAAERIMATLRLKPKMLLCAAGGSTPLKTYQLLAANRVVERHKFDQLRLLKLDEWGGLELDDPGSCETQMRTYLIDPLGVEMSRYIGFNSNPADPEVESARIRSRLTAEGPIDLCILGLGANGHIGMNEPAQNLQPAAHVARLTEQSLGHSMLSNAKKRPAYGLTLGMAEILASREILLLVSGANKRQPLERLLRREITTEFPASFLWLHSNWTLGCDVAALPAIAG